MRFKRKERRMRRIPMTIFYELMGLLHERTWVLNLSSWNGTLNGKRGYAGRNVLLARPVGYEKHRREIWNKIILWEWDCYRLYLGPVPF